MRIWNTIIVLSISFYSCTSTSENKPFSDKIIGEWKTESCLSHFVHAAISVPLTDSFKIPEHRITTNFSIHLKQNSSFSLENVSGPTKTGKYILIDSSLVLDLYKDSISWLTFEVDNITDNRLFLSSKSIQFYSSSTDSLDLFTGDKVDLIMKRK